MLEFIDKKDSVEGFEGINIDTIAIPFIKIAQDLSPQLKKTKPEYIEGLEVGDMFNTVTGVKYGKSFDFTVIKFEHIYTEWKPDRGGFVGYHTPDQAYQLAVSSKFNQMKTAEGNDLVETYMYYIIIAGREKDGVAILSVSSTGIKNAKKLNSVMNMQYFSNGDKALPYHQIHTAKSVLMTSDKNEWFVFDFSFKDFVDEALYLAAKEQRGLIGSRAVDYAQLESKNQQSVSVPY